MYPDGRMQAAEFTKLSADYEGAHYTQRLREKQAAKPALSQRTMARPLSAAQKRWAGTAPAPAAPERNSKNAVWARGFTTDAARLPGKRRPGFL